MIVLKTTLQWKFGQTNNLPFVGDVTFGADGTFEVIDDTVADQLVKAVPDIKRVEELKESNAGEQLLAGETGEPLAESNTGGALESDNQGSEDEGLTAEESLALKASVMKKNMKELHEMASISLFPEEEWKELDKKSLQAYLISKF